MWKSAAAMLAGALAILVSPELPAFSLLAALGLPLIFAGCYWRSLRWLLWLPLGAVWCWAAAHDHLASRLDAAYEGREVALTGWVSSLPRARARQVPRRPMCQSAGS